MRYIKRTILLCLLISIFSKTCLLSNNVYLDYNHWAYNFLDRLAIKHIIPNLPKTKPYSRIYCAKIINILKNSSNLEKLDKIDKSLLNELKRELFLELSILEGLKHGKPYLHLINFKGNNPNWHLFHYRDDNLALSFDYIFKQKLVYNQSKFGSNDSTMNVNQKYTGGTFWGYYKKNLSFYFKGVDSSEKSDQFNAKGVEDLIPAIFRTNETLNNFRDSTNNKRFLDIVDAYLSLSLPWFNLEFGKEFNQWGPGRSGQLIMSGSAPHYDYFKFSMNYKAIRFTSIHGKLFDTDFLDSSKVFRAETVDSNNEIIYNRINRKNIYRDRYIAAHRMEISLLNFGQLGINEVIIYADRNIEFGYINPLMFYWSAEHSYNDQDNSTISLDITMNYIKNLELYGELLIDDLTFDSLSNNWFGNKWAYTAGFKFVDPPYLPHTNIIFEYTRIEPWVYSHWTEINRMSQKGTSLGYWLGPNADHLFFQVEHEFPKNITSRFIWRKSRQAQNYYSKNKIDSLVNIGGDMQAGHSNRDTSIKDFLNDGNRYDLTSLGFELDTRLKFLKLDKYYLNFVEDITFNVSYYIIKEKIKALSVSNSLSDPFSNNQLVINLGYNF